MRDVNLRNRNRLLSERVIKGLESRHMHGYYAENADEALKIALDLIPEGSSVGYGGSMTIDALGLKEALENGNRRLIRRELAKTPEEQRAVYQEIYGADVFLSSSNAMTEDGMLVNIDGSGNRVSCICFGPSKVVMVVGMQKIQKDLDSAMKYARNTVAPANNIRLGLPNPCTKTGTCMNCLSPDSICSQFLVTRVSRFPDRIHVILVNEELGY